MIRVVTQSVAYPIKNPAEALWDPHKSALINQHHTPVFSGVIMPILILRGARKHGDRVPLWQCNWIMHPLLQVSIVLLYLGSAVYAIASRFGYFPAGWRLLPG